MVLQHLIIDSLRGCIVIEISHRPAKQDESQMPDQGTAFLQYQASAALRVSEMQPDD
jgi:hypothetical protein